MVGSGALELTTKDCISGSAHEHSIVGGTITDALVVGVAVWVGVVVSRVGVSVAVARTTVWVSAGVIVPGVSTGEVVTEAVPAARILVVVAVGVKVRGSRVAVATCTDADGVP